MIYSLGWPWEAVAFAWVASLPAPGERTARCGADHLGDFYCAEHSQDEIQFDDEINLKSSQ